MRCDICGNELKTDYRILNLQYELKELPPPKPHPFKQKMKSIGLFAGYSGDVWLGAGRDLGLETFIEGAIICKECEPKTAEIIDALKTIFQSKEKET